MSHKLSHIIYLAASLFSEAELSFNHCLKRILLQHCKRYLPQDDAFLIVGLLRNGVLFSEAEILMLWAGLKVIRDCDELLTLLDGRTVDESASVELGYAYALNKPCVGYSTDPRQLLANGQNPMVTGCLEEIFTNCKSLIEHIVRICKEGTCVSY